MKKHFVLKAVFFMALLLLGFSAEAQAPLWVAPAKSNTLKNPHKGNATATMAGKTLFNQYCGICHGNRGKGDGIGGMSLNPKPANFTKDVFQAQSDGAIFWKISEGRNTMAPYKGALTEEQRWQLVNYLRVMRKK